jgi:hypothetical protein
MKKQNIGAVVILAGIGIIGFIWFKRNKPTTADKQLADLTVRSNALNTGSAESIDKPFEYSQETINSAGSNPYTISTVGDMYSNLTPAQIKDLGEAVNQACPSCANLDFGANITNQIAQNMQNSSLNQLSNYDFSSVDWSNIKI